MSSARPMIAAVVCSLLLAGCGDDDRPAPHRPVETVDPLPSLPPGWTRHVNGSAGFAIGVPPGWAAQARGTRSELRSPDRLVAVRVTADRTNEALQDSLRQLASATISALPRIENLEPGQPRAYRASYEAVVVDATGVAGKDDVRQRLLLVVMRRDRLAVFTALVARNAEHPTGAYSNDIDRMLRSLRGRPISPPSLTRRAESREED